MNVNPPFIFAVCKRSLLSISCLLLVTLSLVGCGKSRPTALELAQIRANINKNNDAVDKAADKPIALAKPPAQKGKLEGSGTSSQPVAASQTTSTKVAPTTAVAVPQSVASPTSNVAEREAITKRNLQRISKAMQLYVQEHGRYPTPTFDNDQEPGLSWRVTLLPYLGYQALYDRFDIDRRSGQGDNFKLINEMPDVYRTPGTRPNMTCYVAMIGNDTMLNRRGRSAKLTDLIRGAENTIWIMEVDNGRAVPWTSTDDYKHQAKGPLRGIGGLYGVGPQGKQAYALWADGVVAPVLLAASPEKIMAACLCRGATDVTRAQLAPPGYVLPMTQLASNATTPTSSSTDTNNRPGRTTSSASPVDKLVASYLIAAEASSTEGMMSDAWQWYYGAIAAGAPAERWLDETKWVPGLQRPTVGLHWAVGIATDDNTRGRQRPSHNITLRQRRENLLDRASPFSSTLLPVIEELAAKSAPQLFAPEEQPGNSRHRTNQTITAPVSYLETSPAVSDLVQQALAAKADVLAVFKVDTSSSGRTRDVQIYLYDMMRKQPLQRWRDLSARNIAGTKDFEPRESAERTLWQFKDYLEDSLTPSEWPVELQPRMAKKRTQSLATTETAQPLKAILEMQYYNALNLIDNADLLVSVNQLIGEDQGTALLLGGATKRRRVLREWLPSDDPAAVVAVAKKSRRANEDD